jgi:hypothetical protein
MPVAHLHVVGRLCQFHVAVHVDDCHHGTRRLCLVWPGAVERPAEVKADLPQRERLSHHIEVRVRQRLLNLRFALIGNGQVAPEVLVRATSSSAQLDGANPLVFLFRILIPLSWNAIGALCVIQFVYVWNMYLWPLIINREEDIKTIQVGLNSLNSVDAINELGTMTTGAIIATIPPIIVFILLQRQFMSGFAVSRDK